MLPRAKHVRMLFSILMLLGLFCWVPAHAANATIYDANADFSITNNPNGVWTYGWASTLASLPAGLNIFPNTNLNYSTPNSVAWVDNNNLVLNTPDVYKNFGGDYNDGNVAIPAGALIQHGGGNSGFDLSVVEFTAPSAGQYSLSASFIGRQYGISEGLVYILDNGTTIFNNGGSFITTVGDTATYSAILNLNADEKIDFAVVNALGLGPDSTELQAVFNTAPVPVPPTFLLLGSGLLGLVGWRRFRKV